MPEDVLLLMAPGELDAVLEQQVGVVGGRVRPVPLHVVRPAEVLDVSGAAVVHPDAQLDSELLEEPQGHDGVLTLEAPAAVEGAGEVPVRVHGVDPAAPEIGGELLGLVGLGLPGEVLEVAKLVPLGWVVEPARIRDVEAHAGPHGRVLGRVHEPVRLTEDPGRREVDVRRHGEHRLEGIWELPEGGHTGRSLAALRAGRP